MLSCHSDFDGYGLFQYAGRLPKSPEAEQLAPVGVQRYGRARVAMEVKILAKQESFQLRSSENFLTLQIIQTAESLKSV